MAMDPVKLARMEHRVAALLARIEAFCAARGDADWNEADHPRASNGQFGSGGGSGGGDASARRNKANIDTALAKAGEQRAARNLMLVSDMEKALGEMGHSKDAIASANSLLRQHSVGSPNKAEMRAIDEAIEAEIEGDTDAGKALLDSAYLEERAYRAWQAAAPARHRQELASLKRDWDDDFEGSEYKRAGDSFEYWIEKKHPRLADPDAIPTEYLFRRGGARDGVSSWTQDPRGADIGGAKIIPTEMMAIDDALASGGLMLGGLSRMMGSSGEAEVTMYFPKGTATKPKVYDLEKKQWRQGA